MAAEQGKIYYSMGEVAEMMDVSPTLVRFWEKKFDILSPRKNKKGNRQFSPEDVRVLKTIYHLVKERGMTLTGAARHLKAAGRGTVERDMEIAERLGAIRALLIEVRNELGGEGIVVGEAEEVVGEPEQEVAVEVGEPEAVEMSEIGMRPEPETEPEPEPEKEPEKSVYVEQTLF
jgi:DNA-binding transcriptional MerR regulator